MAQFTEMDASRLLYGLNSTPGIVSVEPSGPNEVDVFQRQPDGSTIRLTERQAPWIVVRPDSPMASRRNVLVEPLAGNLPLSARVIFRNRAEFRDAVSTVANDDFSVLAFKSPITQYLIACGNTLFKDMQFEDLRRLQLDIETLGLDPDVPEAEVIMVALRQGDHEDVLVQETTEADLLERLVEAIQRLDPDVIEGHNIFLFDLPYLIERARRTGVVLGIGRDASPPTVAQFRSNFRVGPVSLPYTSIHVRGRHIVDTYQQIQRWDIQGRLSSYGLKSIMRELDLERDDRVHVEGQQIANMWRSGERSRDRLARYALDDVRDVERLSGITLPTEFYQTQIVPMALQTATTAGMGTKIDHLMVRAYLQSDQSVPLPQPSRPYAGAHMELIRTGSFGPVVKADVESLYPSIMLENQITSRNDVLGAFPLMLRDLTARRIDAKRNAAVTSGAEHALWDGLQGTFKVLINSFYGYLGFGRGRFNDFDAAERVTLEGQRLIQIVVSRLREEQAEPIEVDTDGVFFTPPPSVTDLQQEEEFIRLISSALPGRIRLAHDGRYERMLSLKLKNYALLSYDGTMTMKGSALRSRRMEPCFRQFLLETAHDLMQDERDRARERYFVLAERILTKRLPLESFSQWSMLRQSTIGSRPRLKELLDRSPGRWRFGERVSLYERADGSLGFTEDYAQDENTTVLLRHLRDTAARFELLFDDTQEFDAFFPVIQPTTSLDIARQQKPTRQLGLFG
ncbi:MAG: ribonuclease H-like domain-containing protein [Chloroflexota bacterium]|nr:ribonuclease H-like domain-containing protein [Chloroflexota bacterium]